MAAITLDIGGNTRQLDRDIQKTVNKVYTINLKTKGDQPLGRITGKVNEFNKSLDASNARVIAFGASAGIIFGVERAFTALVSATIEVQKSLQDINVILNASQANLQKFGAELFNIARNTGQSFQEVAKAATEFSRQGLGIEETLKRTNEALILSRLSGLDAAKSVESLTAAVNSFASQAVTATEVVNKFATVDAAFAVSSADLADAIARVGSSAAQSGVSLNELIAIVTSAQQTTARGGAVIGNSFKTIFTRLQREKVVDLLESLGISGTDASGQVKSTIQLLQDLGKVYDTLGAQQQAYVAEQVGGVFQINILKAALADLGKEYSIYSSALNVAAGATDQAIRRNEELNKTYAAQINALAENARQLAAAGGERLLGPSIDRLVGGTNTLLEGFSEADGQNVGSVLGKGILDGIGQFIAGPGLALIGGVLLKLFRDLAKFATGSVQQLLGLNTAATQQRDLQQSINSILAKNPQLLELALKGEQGLNQAANSLLASLQKQTVELQKQAAVAAQISKAFIAQAGVRVAGGIPVVPTGRPGKAAGYIPNFASDKLVEKYTAISLGATRGVRPIMSQGTIGGRKFVMNNQEVEFPGVGKNGDSMVLPTYGDGPRIAAAGFIPNFAKTSKEKEIVSTGPKKIKKDSRYFFSKYGYLVPPGQAGKATLPPSPDGKIPGVIRVKEPNLKSVDNASNKQELNIEQNIKDSIVKGASNFTNTLKPLGRTVDPNEIKNAFETTAGAKGALGGAVGAAFEVGITKALDYKAAQKEGGDFDVRGGKNLQAIQNLFGISVPLADFKVGTGDDARESFYNKIYKEEGLKRGNEAEQKAKDRQTADKQATSEVRAFSRQKQKEFKNDPIKAAEYNWFTKDGKLIGAKNFPGGKAGLDKVLKQIEVRRQRIQRFQAATGYIPNFAAPLVRAVDDKELRMMLSKFGKGWAFQGRSSEQSALEYFGGSGTYMWDALSRPGEQMSDRQAYKQNIGRAKNWSSARKQSSWLVRYNRSKLKDSELLPDMETGGASVYGLPLSKDQIVWPIKQSGGPGRIFEKDIPAFLSGQVNDAIKRESEAGIPKNKIYLAQEKALTSANPMGLGVFNKLQEPTKQSRKDAMRRKGFASGYVPNFAIEDPDVQAADAGTALAAITAQLSGLAFAFAFNKEELKQSLEEIAKKNKEQGKATTRLTQAQVNAITDLRKSGQITGTEALSRLDAARYAPTSGQKLGGFLKANTLGLSVAAPILGETIKNVVGQETPGARKTGAIASAAGQIGSFAATGALIAPGPVGAGVGAAVGALLTIPSLVDELTSSMPELAAAANKASQDLTKFGDVGQRLLTASSELSRLLTEGGSQEAISKAQDVYAKALYELSDTDRDRLSAAAKVGKLEEEYAKVLQEKVEQTRSTERFVKLQALEEKKNFGIIPAGFDIDSKTREGRANIETLGNAFKGFFTTPTTLPQELKDQIKAGKITEQQAILQNFQRQKEIGLPQLEELKTATDALKGRSGKVTQEEMSLIIGKEENLASILQNIIPESETKAEDINQLVNLADDDTEAFSNVLKILIDALKEGPEALKKALDAAKLDAEANQKRTEALKKSSEAINATISTIQKNIAVQNLLARTLDITSESFRSISADINIARKFTQPAEALEQVIGTDKAPAMALRAQSDVAIVEENLRSGIAGAGIELKDTIRGIFQKPFQEQRNELTEKLSKTNITGTPEEIETETAKIIDQYKPLFEQNDKANENLEKYLSAFASGQISQEQLLNDLRSEMSNVGIDVNKGTQASNEVELAIANFRDKTIQEQVKAFQQRAKLASETKQAILQDKINQALNTFGGFEGFMNRPEEEQNYIQSLEKDFKTVRDIRNMPMFRYGNVESQRAMAGKEGAAVFPDLGRSFAKIFKGLISQSGGAFRTFIQRSIDAGPQLTGLGAAGGKDTGRGGFDDIVVGRIVDIENQLNLAKEQLKIETDPTLQKILQGFIDSIETMPGGIRATARLQTMQEFGVGRQSGFKDLYGQYEVQALGELEKISPELAASLADATSLTNDPILDQATYQSNIQTQMLGYLGPIQDAILQIANLGGGTGQVGTGTKQIEAYKPKLTEEQQKKADEFRKKQEEVLKKEADIKAKKAQEAAMPKEKRSISEIEAETRAKRDQKYLQSQLAPRSRETGEKFESIAQIENEMTKLRSGAMGPMTKEDGQYYRVLENFKASLNPVKQTSGNYYDRITSSAGYNFREGMYLQDIDRNTPMSRTDQIQANIERARDQKRFEAWSQAGGMGLGPIASPELANWMKGLSQYDMINPVFSSTQFGEKKTGYSPNWDKKVEENHHWGTRYLASSFKNDIFGTYSKDDNSYGKKHQEDWVKSVINDPFSKVTYGKAMQGVQYSRKDDTINNQSFTQQEASLNANTNAISTLNEEIRNLTSAITEKQNTDSNNQTANAERIGGGAQVTTTANTPVSVTVNAKGGGDVANIVGSEIEKSIPEIVNKVRSAMGEKIPPTIPKNKDYYSAYKFKP